MSALCKWCERPITSHYLAGMYAYCDPPIARPKRPAHISPTEWRSIRRRSSVGSRRRSSFTIAEVNHLRRVLGHPISNAAHTAELDERRHSE